MELISQVLACFLDPLSVTFLDRIMDEEQRCRTIGTALDGVLLVAHTIREFSQKVMSCSGLSQPVTPPHQKGNSMKKNKAPVPDSEIDLSDIPETTPEQFKSGVRGMFARPETRQISIRLSAEDLLIANKIASAKGLPYQTYIKSLLHEALAKEIQTAR